MWQKWPDLLFTQCKFKLILLLAWRNILRWCIPLSVLHLSGFQAIFIGFGARMVWMDWYVPDLFLDVLRFGVIQLLSTIFIILDIFGLLRYYDSRCLGVILRLLMWCCEKIFHYHRRKILKSFVLIGCEVLSGKKGNIPIDARSLAMRCYRNISNSCL